jgi:anaerobic selenocysteine-containing dehydrogenase
MEVMEVLMMIEDGTVKSTCNFCAFNCGVLVHMKDGKINEIVGDTNAPLNKGLLCPKGVASLEHLYHADRLNYPLKRTGEKGEGKWQQITWEEALSTIADKMIKAKDKYGPESIAFLRGGAKGVQDGLMTRLANVFGTPNVSSAGFVCYHPMLNASKITFGSLLAADYDYPPACIVLWGINPTETFLYHTIAINKAIESGSKLIVVDPRKTELAAKADYWVRIKPGSDLALALALLHVVVNEGLYDKDFVDNYTVGFNELRDLIQDYTPEKVEQITWVPTETIKEIAKFYAANKPASIETGNALEQNINNFQANRSIFILQAITGNIGRPGGVIHWETPPVAGKGSSEFDMRDKITSEMLEKRLGAEFKIAPIARWALPQSMVHGLITGKPYPLHGIYVQGGNFLLSWANAQDTYQALTKLDFLAVADYFMTPTAALADIVLPVGNYLEYDSVRVIPFPPMPVQITQKVVQVAERWSDSKIYLELAKKMGMQDYFWKDEEELNNAILKPSGVTFQEFRQIGILTGRKQYRLHEKEGFNTPSGKIEIYSESLKKWGFDPLPVYHEMPETPLSDPDLAQEYPLVFTSYKPLPWSHSQGRQIDSLRSIHPEPIVNIHPETAMKLGINEHDMVYIETLRGKIKQKAVLADWLDPRVVIVDDAWWFPEKGRNELYGWAESNINILTNNRPPYSREMGSTNLRGILCRVYRA